MSDGFFSDTHVTEAGLQGSAGPAVGVLDMVQQGFRQQYRVDSAMALDQELYNRWQESLQAAGLTVDVTGTNPYMMRDFAQFVRDGSIPARPTFRLGQDLENMGQPVDTGPDPEFEDMRRANEAIRQLNNPHIKTFEQILEEVSVMQRGVEQETASMSERTGWGGAVGEMLGAMAGSFTLRDPLNVLTAPIGAGRTIAMKIATDMAVAGVTTAVTEFTDVGPNRALAGLPERNPYYDIVASTFGAGVLRGGFEGLGHGLGRLHERLGGEDINFDLRDAQLQQMFQQIDTPTARAASSVLDDTIVFEHSNPYGEGQVAGYRWQAELEATAHALNGEPEARLELPPIPSEYIDRQLSFQSVKETAPELWNELEAARSRVAAARELTEPAPFSNTKVVDAEGNPLVVYHGSLERGLREFDTTRQTVRGKGDIAGTFFSSDPLNAGNYTRPPIGQRVKGGANGSVYGAHLNLENPLDITDLIKKGRKKGLSFGDAKQEAMKSVDREVHDGVIFRGDKVNAPEYVAFRPDQIRLVSEGNKLVEVDLSQVRKDLRKANKEYAAAYRAVEAEAGRLELAEAAKRSIAQTQSINVLGPAVTSEPMTGPLTRFDFVEAHAGKVEAADAAIPAKADAVNELEINPETNTVDIGTKTPVSADFKVPFEDGELSVKEILDDLSEDQRLEEAVKGCAV